jgi:hypothetical protein
MVVIGFCTPCMNRRWQLERTLPHNLELLRGTPHFQALCDYNSSDGLDDLIRTQHRNACADGRLQYFHTSEPDRFHACRAKNLAHRLALLRGADVLFNLDADNFITAETVAVVSALFTSTPSSFFHQWSRVWDDGTFGRIALAAADWRRLGGYDETLEGMAWQDVDLLVRARAIGLQYHGHASGLRKPVPNSFAQKVANLGLIDATSEATALREFRRLNTENMLRSLARPIVLSLDKQQPFRGTLGLHTETVI